MTWSTRKLSPEFGVEIVGVNLSEELTESEFAKLREIWNSADGIILLRQQEVTPKHIFNVAKRFGDIYVHHKNGSSAETVTETDAVKQFCGVKASGTVTAPPGSIVIRGGIGWHSEHSNEKAPPSVTISRTVETSVPDGPAGGDMIFADQYLAYEALSEPMKRFLDPLKAIHRLPDDPHYDVKRGSEASTTNLHPIVRTHPETGRKALFVNPEFTSGIEGLSQAEGNAILNYLFAHSTSHEFLYRHSWRANDLIIWDNRTLLHYLDAGYADDGYRISQLAMSHPEKPL